MLPSLVAAEIASALTEFVRTQFLPSNRRMTRVIQDFLQTPENLLKGPYLSVALPFQAAPEGGEAFPEVPLGFVPWRHQRAAFDRLGQRQSTVVATGTGSGKTECFLLPILDHCRRHSGEPGIKAILIYPMNALANDQAARIAKLIHTTRALRGRVTAGIYIGQDRPSGQATMTERNILADRTVIVDQPPDILLTNYKMLDYLLSRPSDQRLWRNNAPGTLRWLVVDELHTFDGAQGTDLACLIRRLKVRLGTGGSQLTCVGTSATLGASGTGEIRDYVARVFGEPFGSDSIIGESRQTVADFLRESPVQHHLPPGVDLSQSVDPSRFENPQAYLRHQCEVFFGTSPSDRLTSTEWRSNLGHRLRSHATFHRLLESLQAGPKPVGEVAHRLRPSLPSKSETEAIALVNGLVALISHARSPDGDRPFLDVSAHLWTREMGRMVCSISEDPPVDEQADDGQREVAERTDSDSDLTESRVAPRRARLRRNGYSRLRPSDDIDPSQGPVHLPLVQCQTCHVTGWGASLGPGGERVSRDIRTFYNQFFDRDVDVRFLFPASRPTGAKGSEAVVCGSCGYLGPPSASCETCGPDQVVDVFVPDQIVDRAGSDSKPTLSRDCPYCTARKGLSILGARSTVLVSAALAQIYGSRFNDDARVIAFSDNVQDAAHRAAFVAHRTWRTAKRVLIAQAVPEDASLPLAKFPKIVQAHAQGLVRRGRWLGLEEFVARFVSPDRTWLRDFKEFEKAGRLERESSLPNLVRRRLQWEALSEVGFGARRAHSLQRARVAAVGPNLARLDEASRAATRTLREEVGGLENLSVKQGRWIALGILRRMLQRGAIASEDEEQDVESVRGFLKSGCNSWNLYRNKALPDYGSKYSPLVFPHEPGTPSTENGTEPLARSGPKSWYQRWVSKVLFQERAILLDVPQVLQTVLTHLREQKLVVLRRAKNTLVWAVNPDEFRVRRDARVLRCTNPARELIVPPAEARLWIGAPCMDLAVQDRYARSATEPPTWAGRMYRNAAVRRIWAAEHTALLARAKRNRIQRRFAAEGKARRPLSPNLLSATPTLEMGIDIGDLSTVVLCSVPPGQANFLQRIGRAGRRDGNALSLTVAAARAHDLTFYADPLEMLHGAVSTPGLFLNASAVLERQLTSFCLDDWAASCGDPKAVPKRIGPVLEAVRKRTETEFPFTFFAHIARYRDALFQEFTDAFGESLSEDSKEYLRKFLWGRPDGESQLEGKILKRLEHALKEQDAIGRDVRNLGRRLRDLKNAPDDKETERDRQRVDLERRGLGKLRKSLGQRDTFGFLTDEGLIPNYAFPEEGVTLRSVIVNQPAPEAQQQQPPAGGAEAESGSEVYQYVRPASAALSELALENRFFAEGHRVTIDRINLAVSSFERWRFCPNCTHMERIEGDDSLRACPLCGDPMWSDSGQAHTMLPLRLVHATSKVREAQIKDDLEVRDPLFYKRHLVAEPDAKAARKAYGTPPVPGEPAFGFEYVSATTFREINFGPQTNKGSIVRFDGSQIPRVGFRVCKKCGRVQSRRSSEEPRHDWTCSKIDHRHFQAVPDTWNFGRSVSPVSQDPDIVDCLYLYREFVSESLTILMPGLFEESSGIQVQSFIAAVELGLKQKYRGKVDHIRVIVQRKLTPGDSARRTVLILYDSVPGGTGYLKDLVGTSTRLIEVFRTARDRIQKCDCDDGCHRCLRAYRPGPDLPNPSKREAIAVLKRILERSDGLEPIATIDRIAFDGFAESELEARFRSALRIRAAGTPGMAFRNAIVRGRRGWALTLNKRTWSIEAQVNLGAADGVVEPSKPDFVMYPPDGDSEARPIAVFLDGFEFHKNRIGEDSVKRMALVRAGYLQWSLTWQDLDSAFSRPQPALDLLRGSISSRGSGQAMARVQRGLDGRWNTGPLRQSLHTSPTSFDLLLRHLEDPDFGRWQKAVFTDVLCLFDHSVMATADFRQRLEASARDLLPGGAQDRLMSWGNTALYAGGGPEFGSGFENANLFVSLSRSALSKLKPDRMSFALHLDDSDPSAESYQEVWNGSLRLFNLVQFLSEPWWTTATAVAEHAYPAFRAVRTDGPALDGAWGQVFAEADDTIRTLVTDLATAGTAPPDVVGYEFANASGVVVAEAELAWTDRKVAVLMDYQLDYRHTFENAGWIVLDQHAPPNALQEAVGGAATGR
ncbi:MAG: DEAD/DEAH box helicase [Bryobacterales bacterium]|nr:DEAD/DEAH box helicase [Bryobacterales bacterium]